jgi:nicotinamide N-methyltransferase
MGVCASSPENPDDASESSSADGYNSYMSLDGERPSLSISISELSPPSQFTPTATADSRNRSDSDATDATDATDVLHPLKDEHLRAASMANVSPASIKIEIDMEGESKEKEKEEGKQQRQQQQTEESDDEEEVCMLNLFGDPEDKLIRETEATLKWDTYKRERASSAQEGGGEGETLNLCLVEKHHSLWGEFIYNAARVLSDLMDAGTIDVQGLSTIEMGAGAGLPSIIAALNGATSICITDYGHNGDRGLIQAIDVNIEKLRERDVVPRCVADGKATGHPYVWGTAVDRLLAANGGQRYDVVIMADCIFNRASHKELVKSMVLLLKDSDDATCYCSFSHHDPQKRELDRVFLTLCVQEGYMCQEIHREQRRSYPFFEEDGMDEDRGWVYVYAIRRAAADVGE